MKTDFRIATELARQLEPTGTMRMYFSNDLQMWFMNLLPNPHARATASGNHADPEECLRLFIESCRQALGRPDRAEAAILAWMGNADARKALTGILMG